MNGEASAHRRFSCPAALVTILQTELWEIFRGVLGVNLSGHVSQELGHNVFSPTLEKVKYELLAYEGAPRAIRWGGWWVSYIKSWREQFQRNDREENKRQSYKETQHV